MTSVYYSGGSSDEAKNIPMVGIQGRSEINPNQEGLLDNVRGPIIAQYDHKKSIILSIGAAIFFGIANFLLADISAKNGIEAIYPQCIMCISLWIFHHGYGYLRFQMKKK